MFGAATSPQASSRLPEVEVITGLRAHVAGFGGKDRRNVSVKAIVQGNRGDMAGHASLMGGRHYVVRRWIEATECVGNLINGFHDSDSMHVADVHPASSNLSLQTTVILMREDHINR